MKRRKHIVFVAAMLSLLAAAVPSQERTVVTTFPAEGGNRYLEGSLQLEQAQRHTVSLGGTPQWISGAANARGASFLVVMQDGEKRLVTVTEGETQDERAGDRMAAPPVAIAGANADGPPSLEPVPSTRYAGNRSSAPAPLLDDEEEGQHLVITAEGELLFVSESRRMSLSSRALSDSRIVRVSDTRLIALGNPSNEYGHGILGDRIEPKGFILIETGAGRRPFVFQRSLRTEGVMETLIPLAADVEPGGSLELVVPVSTSAGGTRIVVADVTGSVLAEGPDMGQPFRWRHPLAVGPLGPDGETEIVVTKTPHIGGSLEYYRLSGETLELLHSRPGYSTHRSGARNLDMALAGDFTGDGRADMLVPTQGMQSLAVVSRTRAGSEEAARIRLPAPVSSNLFAARTEAGRLVVAVGLESGDVLIWR